MVLAGEDKPLPTEEFIERKIERLTRSKGQIEAQYQSEKDKQAWGMPGPYSWLDFIIGELLGIYHTLKIEEEGRLTNGQRWRTLIGLAPESSAEQVESRLKEMREIFVEMMRSSGERAGRIGNQT